MKVLIIRPGALGDTLMVLPALADLAGRAQITFVGRRPGLDFAHAYTERCLDLEVPGWHRLFLESPGRSPLPVSGADLVVAFFGDEEGIIQQNLNAFFTDVPVHIFPSFPPEVKIHSARYVSECLKAAGLPVNPQRAMKKAITRPLLRDKAAPVVSAGFVMHPGSGDPKKNHPPEFWLKLLQSFGTVDGFHGSAPIILLGPAEENLIPIFETKMRGAEAEIVFCPENDRLMKMLRGAAFYIGQDSGITHLAAMLGTPTIALFRSSDAAQWGPLGPCVKVIGEKGASLSNLIEEACEIQKNDVRQG